jgi:hypothetical protein
MACHYILPAYGDWSLGIMLHDAWPSDLAAVHLTMGEFLRVEDQICPQIPYTVRHLFITDVALSNLKDKQVLRRLKTQIVCPYYSAMNTDTSPDHRFALKNLKSVRTLALLYHSHCKVPDVFSKCVHLRYLWMHNTTQPLPKSFARLYHLQIVRVSMLSPRSPSVIFPRELRI